MSFMKPVVYQAQYFAIEDKYGETHHIDADLVGHRPTIEDFRDYVRGVWNGEDNDEYYEDVPRDRKARRYEAMAKTATGRKKKKYLKRADEIAQKEGWERIPVRLTPETGWIAYMSAPGYMDRTDPTAYDTKEEAIEALLEYYGNGSTGGEPEDWEEEAEECLKERPVW